MKSICRAFAVGLGCCLAAYSEPSAAQASPPSGSGAPGPVTADSEFREGAALFSAGKVRLACEKFTSSLKLDPAPGTLKNLAFCHLTEGKTASAWKEYVQLTSLAEAAGAKKAEQDARAQATALEKRLSRITLTLPDGVTLATLEIDDVSVDLVALREPLPLDPGPHAIHLADTQGRDVRVTANVPTTPGVTAVLVAWPAAVPKVVPAPPPPPKPEPSPLRPVAWSLFGLAGLGVALGTGYGLAAYAHRNDHPNDNAFHDATVSTIAFGVAIASGAAGGFFFWQTRPRTTAASLVLTPTAGVHTAGVAANGTW